MGIFWNVVRQVIEEPDPNTSKVRQIMESMTAPRRPPERTERIRSEILEFARRSSASGREAIQYDVANCDWCMVPDYRLPGKWAAPQAKLLIIFPEGYPVLAPTGFYLNERYRLSNGGLDGHLVGTAQHGAPDLLKHDWHWYCVTTREGEGGWRPSANWEEPDNLWSFLAMAREVLTND